MSNTNNLGDILAGRQKVFHKESSKENQRKRPIANRPIDLKGRVAHMATNGNSETQPMANDGPIGDDRKSNSRINARKNQEIDEYLLPLLMEGMIAEDYWKFHTKAIYTLGLDRYNQLVIESREGKSPQKLLAWKVKGAIELHFKKQLYRNRYKVGE